MLKKLLWVLVGLSWGSYCYSDSIVPYGGQTGNAAQNGLQWNMDNVLPSPPGLDINGVIYRYTPQKQLEDAMKVHVQNKNAQGDGYIFRETDDWTGVEGGREIRKILGFEGLHRSLWGDGSIEVEGTGTVEDAQVIYMYRVDPCYDPQFDPSCPGYVLEMPDISMVNLDDLYDVLNDPNVDLDRSVDRSLIEDDETQEEKERREKEAKEQEEEEEKDGEMRLEKALAEADNSAMFAEALAQSQILSTINNVVNMNTYVAKTISGGTYNEAIKLDGGNLPDSRAGLRNGMAQQLLHQQMVDMQYGK
jgi:hypothetical protein